VKNSVRSLRTSRGLSQPELAEALGVSRQTVSSIEAGRSAPSLPLAFAIARYFGKPVEKVFDADGKN
jgi:putative transcriptional regulator